MKIKEIRKEIFRLAKKSKDLETMHWYMWLDDCFENDEFHNDDLGNLGWRLWVLQQKGEKINWILQEVKEVLPELPDFP